MIERNPAACGRKPPSNIELELLKKLVSENTSLREMARQLKHDRQWVKRIIKEYLTLATEQTSPS